MERAHFKITRIHIYIHSLIHRFICVCPLDLTVDNKCQSMDSDKEIEYHTIIIIQGVFLSLRRNHSLHALHKLVFCNVTSGRSHILDQIVTPSQSCLTSRSFMSTGYPFCDSDFPSIATSPRHVDPPICGCFLLCS